MQGLTFTTDRFTYGDKSAIESGLPEEVMRQLTVLTEAEESLSSGGDEEAFFRTLGTVQEGLLAVEGWSAENVEALMRWPMIERDEDGFRTVTPGPLVFAPTQEGIRLYKQVDGISFDDVSGRFEIHMVEAEDPADALFSSEDVAFIMGHGVMHASFDLSPATLSDRPHPFMAATCAPESIVGSGLFHTLLHTDYLLKMLVNKVEPSASSPFRCRSITQGLLKRMPQELVDRLFPDGVHSRDDSELSFTRTWIESPSVEYAVASEGSVRTYSLSPMAMQVKYESLVRFVRNDDGSVDRYFGHTPNPWYEGFTQRMTGLYDELSVCFPELARLRELAKLCGVSLIFQVHYRDLLQKHRPPTVDALKAMIDELRSNMNHHLHSRGYAWPLATNETVEKEIDRLLTNDGIPLSEKERVTNIAESRAMVRSSLEAEEKRVLEMAATNITAKYAVEPGLVHDALYGTKPGAVELLVQRITSVLPPEPAILRAMEGSGYLLHDLRKELPAESGINVTLSDEAAPQGSTDALASPPGNARRCDWVPTCFIPQRSADGRVHVNRGGVKLNPGLRYSAVAEASVRESWRSFSQTSAWMQRKPAGDASPSMPKGTPGIERDERIINVRVIRRALDWVSLTEANDWTKLGYLSHSALLTTTANGNTYLQEYMGDGKVHTYRVTLKDQQERSASVELKLEGASNPRHRWYMQKHGSEVQREVTVGEVHDIMQRSADKRGGYNLVCNNCTMSQEDARIAIGVLDPDSWIKQRAWAIATPQLD